MGGRVNIENENIALYFIKKANENIIYHDSVEDITLSIPANDFMGFVEGTPLPVMGDIEGCEKAILHPISGGRLRDIAAGKGAKTASIIISDASREVPTSLVSGFIVRELLAAGLRPEDILFVVALGVHRPSTEEERREFIGDEYYGKVRILDQAAFDPSEQIYLGTTSYGTPVEVFRPAYDADLHISIGKTELHPFAGYSGGRKSVLPGISSVKAISANHSPDRMINPLCTAGNLQTNPIHLDMLEAARLYRLDFTVNFVMTDDNQVSGLFAGGLEEAHAAAVEYLNKYIKKVVEGKPDIIVTTCGKPFNKSLYQAFRPITALLELLDGHTTLVFYSRCEEGVESDDMLAPFEAYHDLQDVERYTFENYSVQMDATLFHLKSLKTGANFVMYSPNIPGDVFETLHVIPCEDKEHLMQKAYEVCGKEHPKVLFFPLAQRFYVTNKS